MRVYDLLCCLPLVYDFWSKLLNATRTKVLDFRLVWVTVKTKIVENYENFEIVVQDFTLVLADVLRRKLHLARANIVPILNKGSVKHYPANHRF